jgi:hypothetical protein
MPKQDAKSTGIPTYKGENHPIVRRRETGEGQTPTDGPIEVIEKVNQDGTNPFAESPQMGREKAEGHPQAYLDALKEAKEKETSKSPFSEGKAKGEGWSNRL